MPVTIYQPAPPLNEYIECFWYINAQIPYACEKILPTNTVELIINFGDDFQLREITESTEFRTMNKAWLVGLQTNYLINEITGHSHMLGIRFKPWGIAPFFQLPAQEVQNQVVETDAIWQHLIDDVRDTLYDKVSLAEKFAFLEQFSSRGINPIPTNSYLFNLPCKNCLKSNKSSLFVT